MAKNFTKPLEDRIYDSYTSLAGAGVGGGLFLIAVILGVLFWISREREEDEEVRMEAQKFRRDRTRVLLTNAKEIPEN